MTERSLLIYKPDGSTQEFGLKPVTKIGRSQDNDIPLEDPFHKVSRMHAQILSNGHEPAVVVDLSSANGTLLNGRPVSGQATLQADDVLIIGLYRLIYRTGEAERQEAVKSAPDALDIFAVESASVNLEQLQERPRLLSLAGAGEAFPENQVDLRALELMHDVSIRLARTVTTADVSETAIDLLFAIEGVQRATLMPWSEDLQALREADVFGPGGQRMDARATPASYDLRNVILSRTILRRVREENRPLHIRDARSVAEASGSASIVRAGIQAAMCSPLTFQGRFLGVLYADNLAVPDAFTAGDFRTFTSISAQTGMAFASAVTRGTLLKREVEQAAMRLYLPPQVADQITASEGFVELGGVLQPVTVLFADIRGFTQLSEHLDAQEVVLMLNEFFTAMTEVIFEAGGTLDKYIGDSVMALFGAPVNHPDDVERGLRAAIHMQQEVGRMNLNRRKRGLGEVQIGVGLHTGPAVVGNIGSEQRMQYTAIGDTVNVASRVASTAAPGQILVSEVVCAAAADGSSFKFLGEVKLKGREQKLNIYSVPCKTACSGRFRGHSLRKCKRLETHAGWFRIVRCSDVMTHFRAGFGGVHR